MNFGVLDNLNGPSQPTPGDGIILDPYAGIRFSVEDEWEPSKIRHPGHRLDNETVTFNGTVALKTHNGSFDVAPLTISGIFTCEYNKLNEREHRIRISGKLESDPNARMDGFLMLPLLPPAGSGYPCFVTSTTVRENNGVNHLKIEVKFPQHTTNKIRDLTFKIPIPYNVEDMPGKFLELLHAYEQHCRAQG